MVVWAPRHPEELLSAQELRRATTLYPCWQQSPRSSRKLRISTQRGMRPAHRAPAGTWPGRSSSTWTTWAARWAVAHPVWICRTQPAPFSSIPLHSLPPAGPACPTAPPSGLLEYHAPTPSTRPHPPKPSHVRVSGHHLLVAAPAPPPAPALDPARTGRGQTGWAWHHLHPPPPLLPWTLCSHQHLMCSKPVWSLLRRVWRRRQAAGIPVLPRTQHLQRYRVLLWS